MEVTYRLTREDHQHFYRLAVARVAEHAKRVSGWRASPVLFSTVSTLLTILVLAYFVFSEFIDDVGFFAALLTYVWGVLSMRLCGLYWQRLYWQNWLPDGSPSLGEVRLKLGSDGIEASDASKVGKYSWQAFSEISQSGNLVILWFDRGQGILVPERAFANEEMRQTFIGAARGHVAPTQA